MFNLRQTMPCVGEGVSCGKTTCVRLRTKDTLAERLRRRPAKPMGSARVGSNPTGVDVCYTGVSLRHTMCVSAIAQTFRARGVVVSHPLSMRKALGSIPSVSMCSAVCCVGEPATESGRETCGPNLWPADGQWRKQRRSLSCDGGGAGGKES